jgi:hypothetical protein
VVSFAFVGSVRLRCQLVVSSFFCYFFFFLVFILFHFCFLGRV